MSSDAGSAARRLFDVSEDDFVKCCAINAKSIYLATIHATPVLRAQGGGSFINIASTAGVRPQPGLTYYNGSDGAVITASKPVAAELGTDNFGIYCINPFLIPPRVCKATLRAGCWTKNAMPGFAPACRWDAFQPRWPRWMLPKPNFSWQAMKLTLSAVCSWRLTARAV